MSTPPVRGWLLTTRLKAAEGCVSEYRYSSEACLLNALFTKSVTPHVFWADSMPTRKLVSE